MPMKESTVVLVNKAGVCRWCKCTEMRPCEGGCWWADRQQTLCSSCVALDTAMRTTRGRRLLATYLNEYTALNGLVEYLQANGIRL
jgi:hypothetical protein